MRKYFKFFKIIKADNETQALEIFEDLNDIGIVFHIEETDEEGE